MSESSLREFGGLLWQLADLVRAGESRRSFRAKAYRTAVWALDDLESIDAGDAELLATPGIGAGITSLINEYRSTGHIDRLDSLQQLFPRESSRLRRLPRVTPGMLRGLKDLGVETFSDLGGAIDAGAVASLKGVGPRTLDLWLRIIELAPTAESIPAHEAWAAASSLRRHIDKHTAGDVVVAGAVRRVEEWADRLDLVVVASNFEEVAVFLETSAALASYAGSEPGPNGCVIHTATTHLGIRTAIRVTSPPAAGSALVVATGPPGHLAALEPIDIHQTENDVYRAAGLPWIPPAARERPMQEVERLVRREDLRGDLHVHSEASPDGRMSLATILETVWARGLDYVLITDHTQGLRFGGLDADEIAMQAGQIDSLRAMYPDVKILHGAELNIGRDGDLDLPDEALALLDFAIAGVHSHFDLARGEQTQRIAIALQRPVVRVLAHPFGRRIGIRPGLDVDMEAIIEMAIANGVALETNGHRDRLDLPKAWLEVAGGRGAWFAANSDAHRPDELANVDNAVATLQRAGIGPERVVNALRWEDLVDWITGE
ncbi:MAG: PHP domain-containing protein [Acidimicrobiia bacterium]